MERWITSVGIDVGTSTTKFVASKLRLGRVSSSFSLPRYDIVERVVTYAGPVRATPLADFEEIDAPALGKLLEEQYAAAGLRLADVKTGAVLITGETATKRNAKQMTHLLAERAGDFVVATAGADLESLLAGRGSGAEERSRHIRGIVANIDIGGGTANMALFQRGKLAATVTLHIGGRLLRLNERGELLYVAEPLRRWLQGSGRAPRAGDALSLAELQGIAAQLAAALLGYTASGVPEESLAPLFLTKPPARLPPVAEVMISGGVGQLMQERAPATLTEAARYGDAGPLLAAALREAGRAQPYKLVKPAQTVRATVIGAGMQSADISGATVFIDPGLLPLRNVPVLPLPVEDSDPRTALDERVGRLMETGLRLFDPAASPPFAIALRGPRGRCTYAFLQHLADALVDAARRFLPRGSILAVVCENDMAKALGQALSLRAGGAPPVLCIDQVRVEHGDYIDMGEPIAGSMIPVVVKTLAFAARFQEGFNV